MAAPADDVFRFPHRKFSPDNATFKNFRYLEDYLLDLESSTGAAAVPTIFVAANDATAASKTSAGTTYTCDGVADEVQIQAALDAVYAAGGGKVVLSEGTFTVNDGMTYTDSNANRLILEGMGGTTIHYDAASGSPSTRVVLSINGGAKNDPHTIRDIRWTTEADGDACTAFMFLQCWGLIENNHFIGSSDDQILVWGDIDDPHALMITHNVFQGGADGVTVAKGSCQIAQNFFQGNTRGVHVGSSQQDDGMIYFNQFEGNTASWATSGIGQATAMHNSVNDSHAAGDHSGISLAHTDTTGKTADDHHTEAHTVASHSDTTATGAELETLTDGSDADSLHTHDIVSDTSPQLGAALDGQGFDLNNLGVVFLTEQAEAEVDVAGKGQLWVNTATPNELWFTNDAGTDVQLGAAGAVPEWVSYLAERQSDESSHVDDDFFGSDSSADYTAVNPTGSATATISRGLYSTIFSGSSANDVQADLKALTSPSAPMTIEASMKIFSPAVNYFHYGICLTDGTSTGSNAITNWVNAQAAAPALNGVGSRSGTLTSLATVEATLQANIEVQVSGRLYMRLVWTAANTFRIAVSPDGVSWYAGGAGDLAFTMTPTHFGVAASAWGGAGSGLMALDYLRVYDSDLSV